MGMFDSVWVPCPKCGDRHEFQSKAGDCNCDSFSLDDAPHIILFDIGGEHKTYCKKCDSVFLLKIEFGRPQIEVKTIDDAETLNAGREADAKENAERIERESFVSAGRRFLNIQQPVRIEGDNLIFIKESGGWMGPIERTEIALTFQQVEQQCKTKFRERLGAVAEGGKLVNEFGPYYFEIPLQCPNTSKP